ncbi:hypothetical protein D3C73_1143940 [compost metagenome]
MFKVRFRFFQRFNAAVDRHGQLREITLQLVHAGVIQRWDFTVFFRAQPGQPGLARMNDKHLTFSFAGDRVDEITQKFVAVLVINANTGFDRHRNRYHIAHRLDAVGNQLRIAHQAGTKHPVLYAIRGTAHVEVYLVIAPCFRQLRTLCQRGRVATTKL